MFYGIGAIGTGMQRRRKEIRSERAAIREEFERWKAANPYATAADFHSKVKQLGATTPGGSVALPDGMAIQRMAAENLRRKQEEEAEKARRLRVQNLQATMTETKFLTDLFKNGVAPYDALTRAGMETTPENMKWATSIKDQIDLETAQEQADRAREIESQNRAQRIAKENYIVGRLANEPLLTRSEAEAQADEVFGTLPSSAAMPTASSSTRPAPSSSSYTPATGQPAAQPAAPSTTPIKADDEEIVLQIQRVLDSELINVETPQEAEAAIKAVTRRTQRYDYTPEQVQAALGQSEVYAEKAALFRNNAFNKFLDDATDIANISAVVKPADRSGRSADVPLEKMLETAFNNTGFVADAYIPKGMVGPVADRLSGYFTLDENGNPVLIDEIAALSASQRVARIQKDLEPFGVAAKADIRQTRKDAMLLAPAINSVQDYVNILDGEGDGSYPIDETLAEIAGYGTLAEKKAAKEMLLANLDAEAATFASGDSVAIYGAGFADPRDLLPVGADRDMAPLEQWFKDTRQKILDFDVTKGDMTDGEREGVEAEAAFIDRAVEFGSEPVTEEAISATVELLGAKAFAQGLSTIRTDEDGQVFIDRNMPVTELSKQLTSAEKPKQQAVVRAIAAALDAFEAQRGTGLQLERPKNREGLFGVIAGMISSEISGVRQVTAQFPGYMRAVKDANDQFKMSLEMSDAFSETERNELLKDFNRFITQSTKRNPVNPLAQMGRYAPAFEMSGYQYLDTGADILDRDQAQGMLPPGVRGIIEQ